MENEVKPERDKVQGDDGWQKAGNSPKAENLDCRAVHVGNGE